MKRRCSACGIDKMDPRAVPSRSYRELHYVSSAGLHLCDACFDVVRFLKFYGKLTPCQGVRGETSYIKSFKERKTACKIYEAAYEDRNKDRRREYKRRRWHTPEGREKGRVQQKAWRDRKRQTEEGKEFLRAMWRRAGKGKLEGKRKRHAHRMANDPEYARKHRERCARAHYRAKLRSAGLHEEAGAA